MESIEKLEGLEKIHFCPNCKSNNQIDYERYFHEDVTTDKTFVFGYCHICLKLFVFLYKPRQIDPNQPIPYMGTAHVPKIQVELESVYPVSMPELSKDVPPNISKTYEEGVICLNSNAPHGAVAVFRRTLQKICIDKGATQ